MHRSKCNADWMVCCEFCLPCNSIILKSLCKDIYICLIFEAEFAGSDQTHNSSVWTPGLRCNNFDLLRLSLACLVALQHAYLVGLSPLVPASFGFPFDGFSAVQCFFVVSGYLIAQSWENSKSVGNYLSKRARRVYPAYFMIVMVAALFGVFLTSYSVGDYFMSAEWIRYVFANLVFLNFLQPTLPGIFSDHPEPLVNGPLWTIKIEVMFYVALPIIALISRYFNRVLVFVLIYAASMAWYDVFNYLHESTNREIFATISRQLPGQMSFFISGCFLYYYLDVFKKYSKYLIWVALFFYIGNIYFDLAWLYPAALAVIVIYIAEILPYLGNFGRFGDISYGLYIFHYLVLQTVVSLGLFDSPWITYGVGLSLSILLAYLSWHFVEKPALFVSSHYRTAEQEIGSLRKVLGN